MNHASAGRAFAAALVAFAAALVTAEQPGPWERGSVDPEWARSEPKSTYRLEYLEKLSDKLNQARLLECLRNLTPGERLLIGPGTWSLSPKVDLGVVGTVEMPVWIEAADPEHPPVITRPDAKQNVLNIGERAPARYLVLRNLELTGGSSLIRIYDGAHIWIDRCHLHHGGGEGITANARDTSHLHLTRNHIHDLKDPSATGEGMYLGGNNAKVRMTHSVIALNHIHDCAGTQGDGIEVKQGSHHNWIVENHVHDTQFPCIILYGTGGQGLNVVERNVCYNSGDNVLQIQGDAIVRNNLVMNGAGAGLAVRDHQGRTARLRIVHNTIINQETAVRFNHWDGREGMVFANNVVYSRLGLAVRWSGRVRDGTVTGNVVFGRVQGTRKGFTHGRGLTDFESLSWDATKRDAHPRSTGKLTGKADPKFPVKTDLEGTVREPHAVPGAYQPRKS